MSHSLKIDHWKLDHLPQHVAFIMDGNRRWAKQKGKPSLFGHRAGEQRIEPLVDYAIKMGIPYLTFWAFSTENWHRSKQEVNFLLNLYRNDLNKMVDRFHAKNVRLQVIGNLGMFPADIQERTRQWMEKTKHNTKMTTTVALSYGGRDEIIRAIKTIGNSEIAKLRNLTKETFAKYLDTAGQPDPDLIIRAGGERRLSGYLLWQSEYSELYFSDVLWPDFTPMEFEKALADYSSRVRRFGK